MSNLLKHEPPRQLTPYTYTVNYAHDIKEKHF